MFSTIITDCRDDNARGRQTSRLASLVDTNVSFIGVQSDIEAGIQLIDVLDATQGAPGIIFVNVAPRGGHTTKWENGTPFSFFYHHDTLIVSTIDGYALSGVKRLALAESVSLLDTAEATAVMEAAGFIDAALAARIPGSQFRSFDFIPFVGAFLIKGEKLPSVPYPLCNIPDLPSAIWHIDNFGNCKTTLTREDLAGGETLETRYGTLPFVAHLRDVPDSEAAVTEGSSGFGSTRWLEFVIQRGPFAEAKNAQIGDNLFERISHLCTATSLEND